MDKDPLVAMTEDFAKLSQLREKVLELEAEVQHLWSASRGLIRLMDNTLDMARTCLTRDGRASRDVMAEVARAAGALQAAQHTLSASALEVELGRAVGALHGIQVRAIALEMEDARQAAEKGR